MFPRCISIGKGIPQSEFFDTCYTKVFSIKIYKVCVIREICSRKKSLKGRFPKLIREISSFKVISIKNPFDLFFF